MIRLSEIYPKSGRTERFSLETTQQPIIFSASYLAFRSSDESGIKRETLGVGSVEITCSAAKNLRESECNIGNSLRPLRIS